MKLTFLQFTSLIYVLMLASFAIGTFIIGGDAQSGKKENNKYYVYGYSPTDGLKKNREVTQTVYTYSLIHIYLLYFTTLALAIVLIKLRVTEYVNRKKEKQEQNQLEI